MPDPSIPTFASGTISIISSTSTPDVNSDSALAGSANGYQNQFPTLTAGSFNAWWNNEILTPKAPVAGVEGNQS